MSKPLIITTQGLNTLLSHIDQTDDQTVWVRSPDYSKQIYLSPSYNSVWKRPAQILYENPDAWGNYLIGDETDAFVELLKSRTPDGDENSSSNNSVLYRIRDGDGNIQFIKDSHFYLYDNSQNLVAVTGIAKSISETQWLHEQSTLCGVQNHGDELFTNDIKKILEVELNLTSQVEPHAVLLAEEHSEFRHIITHDDQKIPLSRREIACLHLTAKGLSAKQVAKELDISHRTVETYLSRIKDKADCKNVIELLSKIRGFAA